MNAAASELDAAALEAVYAHFPNAEELGLLAHAAVDLLERDALAAAGRPLLTHLLHDARSALDRDPALSARLHAPLAPTASLYEDDPTSPWCKPSSTGNPSASRRPSLLHRAAATLPWPRPPQIWPRPPRRPPGGPSSRPLAC